MDLIYNVKGYASVISKKILRILLRITDFVPTQKNKVLFFAGMRGYTCNPKYICEYLNQYYPNQYQLCWIGKERKEIEGRSYINFVQCTPFSLLYALMTSCVYVTNGVNAICPKSNKRLIIGTMHGTPYKKFGYETTEKFSQIDISNSALDIFVSNSEYYTEECANKGFHYKGRVLPCGYPRNDIFFDAAKRIAAANKVKKHYGLGSKVILFAPTYRGQYKTSEKIDFRMDFAKLERIFKRKFGDDLSILIRMHYFDKNQYVIPANIIDAGDWYDMQEILCATDILITDYSSIIWDFALMLKPCFLYMPDIEKYKESRGLSSDPETWPGIICKDMNDLCDAILKLNEEDCKQKAVQYFLNTGSYENGNASETVCREIINFTKNAKKH